MLPDDKVITSRKLFRWYSKNLILNPPEKSTEIDDYHTCEPRCSSAQSCKKQGWDVNVIKHPRF